MSSPQYSQPAEWELHSAVWIAWPSDAALWSDDLDPARAEIAAFCKEISDPNAGVVQGEAIRVLASGDDAIFTAQQSLGGVGIEIISATFGDIWLRDTAPIFVKSDEGLAAACFEFNGWGGKYVLSGDEEVSSFVAERSGVMAFSNDWILEGGSVEVDGAGAALTTRQCLLNPNRNPKLSAGEIETRLRNSLGIESLIWLNDGLVNDHTDGHIDNIARFVAPGVVVCMESGTSEDPNRDVFQKVIRDLKNARDTAGGPIEIITIPSPGRLEDEQGDILPASYLNFYISNTTVIVPVYGTNFDDQAVEGISKLFPTRRTVGLPANHVITGGGSFHCITQQQPAILGMNVL